MYRINWYAKKTGATGYGDPIFKTAEMAQHAADQLNREQPFMSYWVEYVRDADVDEAPPTASEGDGVEVDAG